jgi:hypothetical protein
MLKTLPLNGILKSTHPDVVVVVNLFQNDSFILLNPQNPQFVKRFGSTAPRQILL